MEYRYDEEIMVQIASMYYIDGLTQDKIAKQFGLSRSTVSMILSDAKEYGFVEINIKNPKHYNEELGKQLIERFHIQNCYVIPTSITAINLLTKIIATQGAYIVENEVTSHSTLGVAWGTTTYEFMLAFKNISNHKDVNVAPLIGGTSRISSEYQLNEMVRVLAEKLHGIPTFSFAPAQAESVEDRELHIKSMSMQYLMDKWSHLDAAIISVGSMPEYYNNKAIFDPFVIKALFEQDANRAVGDISGRQLNFKGEFLDNDHNRRLIAIDRDGLMETKKVICIAAGSHKVLSIIGALRTNTIDILITDENTAKTVLEVSHIV